MGDMWIRKEIMYANDPSLNTGFFSSTGIQHDKFLVHKVLSYRLNKKERIGVLGKKPKKPQFNFYL